jgi:MFS family permease
LMESVQNVIMGVKNRKRKIWFSASIVCFSVLLFSTHDSSGIVFVLACIFMSVGFSSTFAISQSALVAEVSPSQAGFGAGVLESSLGAGGSVGPIVAGAVSAGSLSIPFTLPALGFAIALITLPLIMLKKAESDNLTKN